MEEIWKDIPGFEGLYQASNLGRIKSYDQIINNKRGEYLLKGRILKETNNDGYSQVKLYKNGEKFTRKVHTLVALTFINKKDFKSMDKEDRTKIDYDKLEVNHIKEFEKKNNCVDNLEWCTRLYNCNYGTRNQRVNAWKNGKRKF